MIAGIHIRGIRLILHYKRARCIHDLLFAARAVAAGPSRRWRLPELAAGYRGSPVATVASEPLRFPRAGNYEKRDPRGPSIAMLGNG
jgi:hypothetical protein